MTLFVLRTGRLSDTTTTSTPSHHMSARQPFLPSRPASRTVNSGEETSAAPSNVAHAVSNNTSSSNEKNHLELGVKWPLLPPATNLWLRRADSSIRDPPVVSTSPVSK